MNDPDKLKYICVETSMRHGFVSLCENRHIQQYHSWIEDKHSNQIAGSLKKLQTYLEKNEFQFLALDEGPGRFTGVRIGVNFAKVLAYHFQLPIFTCSSLRLLATPYLTGETPVLSLLEAYGNQFFIAGYKKVKDQVQCLIPPMAVSLEELESKIDQHFLCVGDVYQHSKDILSKSLQKFLEIVPFQPISLDSFCSTVICEWDSSKVKSWENVEPSYLRTPGFINKK